MSVGKGTKGFLAQYGQKERQDSLAWFTLAACSPWNYLPPIVTNIIILVVVVGPMPGISEDFQTKRNVFRLR